MPRRKHGRTKDEHREDETPGVEAAAPSEDDGEAAERAGDPAPAEASEPGSSEHQRHDEEGVEELRARAEEMRELAMRKQAEFENFRKRAERERAETIRYASAELVKDILPVLDNLERALEASQSGSESQLREGVGILYRQFKDILEKRGLTEVESAGKAFDPHVHEAVSRVESEDHPEGTIVEVFQKGYWFKDRLLRPAMVSVALPPSGASGDESPKGSE